jgi:membrane protein YqaA with SNARE-associated domain
MRGLLGFLGVNLGGAIGWWLGAKLSPVLAVILASFGAAAGLWWARRWFDDWLG